MQCPHCGQQFLPATEPDDPLHEMELAAGNREDELSELRIRNISNLRRGAYRSRSLLIIAAAVCLVAAVKLVQITYVAVGSGLYRAAIGDGLCVIALLIVTVMLGRRIAVFTAEIRASRLQPPAGEPDFSNLGDGSQRVKDLERLAGQNERRDPL